MLRSMTGFASKIVNVASQDNKTTISISIKSLNSRFFEATNKLHHQLSNLEIELTKMCKDNIHRGHVYLTIHMSNHDFFKGAIEPSLPTIEGYMQAIKRIKERYPIEGTLSVGDLIELPNVFTVEDKSMDDTTKKLILQTVEQLVTDLVAAQEKEGAALKKDIELRISLMEHDLGAIEKASAILIDIQKDKISKTLQDAPVTENSLSDIQKHAAYVLLDKMDINEELVRFKSHLKNLSSTLNSTNIEKGKRLDFTLQEMAREINTIAAKCSDATIGSLAINIKVELEKAREQTQNIV